MKRLLLSLILLVPSAVLAADDSKTIPALRTKAADGWLLLFDGATTFGWHVNGEVQVKDEALILGGDKATTTTLTFGSFEMNLAYRCEGEKPASLHMTRWGKTFLQRDDTTLGKFQGKPGEWDRLTLHYDANTARAEVRTTNSQSVFGTAIGTGRTSLTFEVPAGTRLVVGEAKWRPLGLLSIFSGKDLTGWKEFPGKKSRFAVEEQGLLTIKDGPGDLQTEEQWDDFTLQIDCKTNGKNLNSGVFFRCRPGEYQNGYEAQIHNGFTAEPLKEYTLDEYDPETNKLTGTKKVKYTAQDYGTGGIYRRQPARFQVAQDNEWFTMTVLAVGKHLAVWVNGVQVTDWTDNRPASDNARTGYRLEKGPISLQGHDATTDLAFKNIRIAEVPPEKK
jgi:hypothetical protein